MPFMPVIELAATPVNLPSVGCPNPQMLNRTQPHLRRHLHGALPQLPRRGEAARGKRGVPVLLAALPGGRPREMVHGWVSRSGPPAPEVPRDKTGEDDKQ